MPASIKAAHCAYCGIAFKTSRSHARTCSPRCRVALHRQEKRQSYKPTGVLELHVEPMTLPRANEAVLRWHRHHGRKQTHKFSIGVFDNEGTCHGVAIVDRPANPQTDQRRTAEVSRLATDGTPNACSMLYAACARAAKAMGYTRIQTFILNSEPGTSLKASGWTLDHIVAPGSWSHPSRNRAVDEHTDRVGKSRWSRALARV